MSYRDCFATIFALMAKRMRILLKALDVDVVAVKFKEEGMLNEANMENLVIADTSA